MSHVALVAFLLFAATSVAAHPGRLDQDGCHRVHATFTYRSGKVEPAGTMHCHRKLTDRLRLDGREILWDNADAREAGEQQTHSDEMQRLRGRSRR